MKIRIIAVGKIKEKWIRDGIAEYAKRIKNLEIIEIKDLGKEKEAAKIELMLKGESYFMDETGYTLTSREFAKVIKDTEIKAEDLTLVIGGPDGLASMLKMKQNKIALSKMTFTHEMARLLLVEQIYRGISINQNKKYHRD